MGINLKRSYTGSVCSLIRETAAKRMQTQEATRCFMSFGESKVKVTRQVNVVATIDNVKHEVTLYLVQDELLLYDILVGQDVLQSNGYQMVNGKGVLHLQEAKRVDLNVSSDLSEQERGKAMNILLTYKNCFAESINQIGRCNNAHMTIKVTVPGPILGKRYQVPFSQPPMLSKVLKELLDNDIISPSNTPHAPPLSEEVQRRKSNVY
nr:uncharacterized protein LOC118682809 [Bactrocera oleae]